MKKDKVLGNIEIDESEIHLLKRIESGYDTIELINETGQIVDGNVLADYFVKVPGIDRIKSLDISYSSNLEDLTVVKGFPNLLNIYVNGYKIKSLDGLEHFCNGQYLYIYTEKNRHRSIANISKAPITALTLKYEKEEDFDAISTSTTISRLELGSSPQPPFEKWRKVPLESLKLSSGKLKEFGNTALAKKLDNLILINCRQLERFIGDNSRITWMVIDGSTHLDLSTISTFSSIESLNILTNSNEIPLSTFSELKNLRNLGLVKCNLNIDISKLRESMPKLEKLHIANLKKDKLFELRSLNPEVIISN